MRLNGKTLRRRRRGMSSLFEAVTCVALTGLMIVALLSVMAMTTVATSESQAATYDKISTDLLIDMLQVDVKSSLLIEVTDGKLQLVNADEIIIYSVEGGVLYRNDEKTLTDVSSCSFITEDGNSVGVYLTHGLDEIIDLTISR